MNAFIAVEKMPQIIFQVAPVYPVLARRAGIEGTVYVKILVSKEGKALKAIIIKSDSEVFNQASIDAAFGYLFRRNLLARVLYNFGASVGSLVLSNPHGCLERPMFSLHSFDCNSALVLRFGCSNPD